MGTITFQVVEAGQTTATKNFTLPDAQIDRLVTAYQQKGNTAINGTATRAQVLLTWANELMNSSTQAVLASEQAANNAAVVQATPITPV